MSKHHEEPLFLEREILSKFTVRTSINSSSKWLKLAVAVLTVGTVAYLAMLVEAILTSMPHF